MIAVICSAIRKNDLLSLFTLGQNRRQNISIANAVLIECDIADVVRNRCYTAEINAVMFDLRAILYEYIRGC